MRYIVYKTTCRPSGKYYYGVHMERRSSDGYIGCGVCSNGTAKALFLKGVKSHLIDSVLKYGYKNFNREVLFETKDKDLAYELEELIVDRDLINKKECLNIRLGGNGGVVESKKKKVDVIDCLTGEELFFESVADCSFSLGVKNASKAKRIAGKRYVKKEYAEPISLKDIDGNVYHYKDIYICYNETGIKPFRLRQIKNGERNSSKGLFHVDFDFNSKNYQGSNNFKNKAK